MTRSNLELPRNTLLFRITKLLGDFRSCKFLASFLEKGYNEPVFLNKISCEKFTDSTKINRPGHNIRMY